VKGEQVMKKGTIIRFAVFTILVVVGLAIFASPAQATSSGVYAPIRLTVINNSQFDFSLILFGPDHVSFSVDPGQTIYKVINRGVYSFTMRSCNYTKTGTMNLNYEQTIHVPVCGGDAGTIGDKDHHIDSSDYIKPVRVKIRNKTGETIGFYIRTMENHFFYNFEPGVSYIIIPKDQYVYSYVACGKLVSGYYTPSFSLPFDLRCTY
jgi:hypothetical protein